MRGIFRLVIFLQIHAALEPLLRVQVASGAVVDLFNDLGHQAVVPAQALGIHKGPEIWVVLLGIGPVQQVRQDLIPNLAALIFVCHPEIRGNVQPVGIFPENIAAEAVDCGDFCQIDALHLLLQVPVFRLLGDPLAELGSDFSPQFRGRRLGIGNHQKIVQICRVMGFR